MTNARFADRAGSIEVLGNVERDGPKRHDVFNADDALAEHALLEETERLARRLDHAFQH